jgi:hypothetical protein
MRVVAEPLDELLEVLVQHRVVVDVARPGIELRLGRELAEEKQVRGFEKVAVLRQLFDRIAAVEQDALVAVDERDPAAARRRVHERGIVGHQAEVVRRHLDLPQVCRPDRPILDWHFVLLAGAVVGDRQRIGHEIRSSRLD